MCIRDRDWLPPTVEFAVDGLPFEVEMTSFRKMEQLSARILVMRAKTLREKIGSDKLPPLEGWQHETVAGVWRGFEPA